MKQSEFNLLTRSEQACYYALKNLKGENLWQHSIQSWFKAIDGDDEVWNEAIENQVNHGSAEGFRHLIQSLQSQGEDNPPLLEKILGADAFELVMNKCVSYE